MGLGVETRKRLAAALLASACVALPALAQDSPIRDEDRATFDTLYGEKLSTVERTRATGDDKTLANEMLNFALGLPKSDVGASCLIYEKVIVLASNAAELDLMHRAYDLLLERWAEQDIVSPEKLMQLASRGYRGVERRDREVQGEHYINLLLIIARTYEADSDPDQAIGVCRLASTVAKSINSNQFEAIQDKLERLASANDMAKRIKMLELSVQKNPQNSPAARELVKLLVTQHNDPVAAATYVESTSDAELIDLVKRCALGIEVANPATAMRVADWYLILAEDEEDEQAMTLLNESRKWYEKFFMLYERDDALARRVAEMDNVALLRIERLIEANPELIGKNKDGWEPLTAPPTDPKQFVIGEPDRFEVNDGEITINDGDLVIPFKKGKAYEIRLTLTVQNGRRNEQPAFSLFLPVNDEHFVLTRYYASGETLARVDHVEEERLMRNVPDRSGKRIQLVFQVAELNEQIAFAMLYNGKTALKWQGELEEIEAIDEEQRERIPEDIGPFIFLRCFKNLTLHDIEYKERG
ncbi:MAG: hypothetical protein ACPG4Q_15845 [Phycisphaeraceae bacterium]